MKRISFSLSLILSLLFFSCTKQQENENTAFVTATIGTTAFSSNKANVNVGEHPNPQGGVIGGTEQVTITGQSDASTGTDKDYIVIAFGYKAGDVKSYSIDSKEAIGAYHKSGSPDDVALKGTVTITGNSGLDGSLGKHLNGTFDFTTQQGVHVSSGAFGVQVNY